jgi:hypothetical protein
MGTGVKDRHAGQDLAVDGPVPECLPEFGLGEKLVELSTSIPGEGMASMELRDSLREVAGLIDADRIVDVSSGGRWVCRCFWDHGNASLNI